MTTAKPRIQRALSIDHALVLTFLLIASASVVSAQQTCPAIADIPATPARTAYGHENYKEAQDMYEGEMILRPDDQKSAAGLVQSLLHQGKLTDAATQSAKLLAANPNSAVALTSQAEVQLRQGQPWLALETLAAADKIDPCYARIHYVRSRVLRLDSRYASERAEVQAAYQIDANDPDIRRAWASTVRPAHEILSIQDSLSTLKGIDPETEKAAKRSMSDMMPLLSENNQTCRVLPALTTETTLPLAASYEDARHIGGYKLEVQFAQTKAHLTVDTAASGLFISRALADLNGLVASPEAPAGTVHVDTLKIGGLEFQDCIVGVSENGFPGKSDGFIGTDIFAPWLIDLDQPSARVTLSELPPEPEAIPTDRPIGSAVPPALQGFSPVYHRHQFLLVPVTLNNKMRRLFAIDTGFRLSTMTSEAAHAVSTTKVNFTNRLQTVGGAPIEVYRDAFDFQFASVTLPQQGHIVQFDPANIERSSGIQIAGLLGFDMLHSLDIKLDYRDGLVKFESAAGSGGGTHGNSHGPENIAGAAAVCEPDTNASQPLNTTVQAKVFGLIDSAHLKAGSKFTLKMATGWEDASCELAQDSPLYGHVVEAQSTSSPDSSELSLAIDAGDCSHNGKTTKKNLSFTVIALVGPPDQFIGLQNAMPVQVAGGGRDISSVANSIGSGSNKFSINLNPDGPPETVKHGIVQGMPGVKLLPQGGPGCSAKITSSGRSIRFGAGSQLILTSMAH